MNKPQVPVSVHISKEWRIRRPYVFRYMHREFVDLFFEKGILRLSSFSKFSKHKDEQRLDTQEGTGAVLNIHNSEKGQSIIGAFVSQGQSAYVLCGALNFSEDLSNAFSVDSGFRINDTTSFACAIAYAIAGFRGGLEGSCIYAERRTVTRSVDHGGIDSLRVSPEKNEFDMGKLDATISSLTGDDLFFLKPNKYEHQREYRLIWGVSSATDYIDVMCPDAREFCTRFEDIK